MAKILLSYLGHLFWTFLSQHLTNVQTDIRGTIMNLKQVLTGKYLAHFKHPDHLLPSKTQSHFSRWFLHLVLDFFHIAFLLSLTSKSINSNLFNHLIPPILEHLISSDSLSLHFSHPVSQWTPGFIMTLNGTTCMFSNSAIFLADSCPWSPLLLSRCYKPSFYFHHVLYS